MERKQKKDDSKSNNGAVTITNKGYRAREHQQRQLRKSHDDKQKTMLKDMQHKYRKCWAATPNTPNTENIRRFIGNSISSLFFAPTDFSLTLDTILSVYLVFLFFSLFLSLSHSLALLVSVVSFESIHQDRRYLCLFACWPNRWVAPSLLLLWQFHRTQFIYQLMADNMVKCHIFSRTHSI